MRSFRTWDRLTSQRSVNGLGDNGHVQGAGEVAKLLSALGVDSRGGGEGESDSGTHREGVCAGVGLWKGGRIRKTRSKTTATEAVERVLVIKARGRLTMLDCLCGGWSLGMGEGERLGWWSVVEEEVR
jgi:hypothetical protein